ncbi:hypothetical protein IJ579_04675 [bacterium]|nr:hypothetical protein [bacterium]
MKKYLIAITLILTFTGCAYSQDEGATYEDVMFPDQDVIFKPAILDTVDNPAHSLGNNSDIYYYDDSRNYQEIDPDNMPFFKQMRLKLSNKILETQYKENNSSQTGFSKLKFWEKSNANINIEDNISNSQSKNELSDMLESETSSEIPEKVLSLSGGVNQDVTEKEMQLDAEDVTFDDDTGDMIATGRPILKVPPQNMIVIADKMIYNEYSNILKGIDNVIVYKDGIPTKGDYLEIDMNEETIIMDDVFSKTPSADATAEKAIQKDGLLVLTKGTFSSEHSSINRLATRVAGPRFERMLINPEAQSLLFGNPEGNNLTLKIGSIYVNAKKNHDVYKAKDIKVYHKDKYVFKWPSLTAYTNKQRTYFEANYPELGSSRKVGMFAGPGFVFSGPFGSIMKITPFLNYKKDFGIGGMVKYINNYNRTILGYGSANDIFFLKGDQVLDDNLYLHYGSNTYANEWFLGGRMAKYMVEAYYDKGYSKKDFLGENRGLSFRHRVGFGLMQNDDRNSKGEKFAASNMSTTRTRYMAQIAQNLYSYKDEERRIVFNAGLVMQGSAALYGTGDTQFIARVGPAVHMQYKNWMQDIAYYLSGFEDNTPLKRYDAYRYGRQSVSITEAFRINRYLSVGWSGYINLSDDSPNGKMFQENAFIVSVGPDDCRLIFGYDFTRERTYLGVNVAFDPKGTKIEYEKMEIKNPERLGKKDTGEEEEHQVAFVKTKERPQTPASLRSKNTVSKPAVLQYAKVIEIEDPERERID